MDRKPAAVTPATANQNAAGGGATADTQQSRQQIGFGYIKVSMDQADQLASKESWKDSFKKFMSSIVQETPISTLRAISLIPIEPVPV
jgi:L-ribulose-5-phosphate 3-epimerase UlaE